MAWCHCSLRIPSLVLLCRNGVMSSAHGYLYPAVYLALRISAQVAPDVWRHSMLYFPTHLVCKTFRRCLKIVPELSCKRVLQAPFHFSSFTRHLFAFFFSLSFLPSTLFNISAFRVIP